MQLPHMFRRPIRLLFPSTFRSHSTKIQLPREKSRSLVQGSVCSAELGQAEAWFAGGTLGYHSSGTPYMHNLARRMLPLIGSACASPKHLSFFSAGSSRYMVRTELLWVPLASAPPLSPGHDTTSGARWLVLVT